MKETPIESLSREIGQESECFVLYRNYLSRVRLSQCADNACGAGELFWTQIPPGYIITCVMITITLLRCAKWDRSRVLKTLGVGTYAISSISTPLRLCN